MTQKIVPAIGPRKAVVTVTRVLSYLLYFYIIVVEIILFIGFFLLLFGANPSAGFTQWAYRNLDRVMEPFRGIFTPIELGTTAGNVESIFETSVLFAMIVYGILGMLISARDHVAVRSTAVSGGGGSRRPSPDKTRPSCCGAPGRSNTGTERDGLGDDHSTGTTPIPTDVMFAITQRSDPTEARP